MRVDLVLALALRVFELFQLLFILATRAIQLLQPHALLPILPLIHLDAESKPNLLEEFAV